MGHSLAGLLIFQSRFLYHLPVAMVTSGCCMSYSLLICKEIQVEDYFAVFFELAYTFKILATSQTFVVLFLMSADVDECVGPS